MKKILSTLGLLLAVVLALTPFVLFPVCETLTPMGTPMKCYYSGVFVTMTGIATILLALGTLFFKRGTPFFRILMIIASFFCIAVPRGIITVKIRGGVCGLCASAGHQCVTSTMPALWWIAGGIIVLEFFALLWDFVGGEA